jgi:hypothetical protein
MKRKSIKTHLTQSDHFFWQKNLVLRLNIIQIYKIDKGRLDQYLVHTFAMELMTARMAKMKKINIVMNTKDVLCQLKFGFIDQKYTMMTVN